MEDYLEVTVFCKPLEMIDMGNNQPRIPYRKWLESEKRRLCAKGDKVRIETNKLGEIALVR